MGIQSKKLFSFIGPVLASTFVLAFASPLLAAQNQIETLCVQTFNAYGPAYSSNLTERTRIMGEELAAAPCHVVQLQEVWTEAHHNLAIAAMQRSLPTLSAARFDDFKRPRGGQSGLAIFTSETLTNQSFEQFRVNQDGLFDDVRDLMGVIKGIGSSVVTMRSNDQRRIQMLNVHLHPSSGRVRIDQIIQVLEMFERLLPLKHAVIITGDFNFKPDSIEYALLRDVARLTDSYASTNDGYQTDTCTYCADNPNHWPGVDGVIDYIWTRSGATESLTPMHSYINLMGLRDMPPSDHYGLRSTLTIKDSSLELVDQAEYKQRRLSAITAVVRALAKLDDEGANEQTFVVTRQKLTRLMNRLQSQNPRNDALLSNIAIK